MAKQKNARRALAGAYRRISILLFGNTIRLQINLLYELYVLLLAAARIFGIGGRISVTEEGRKAAAAVRRDGFTKLLSVLPDGDMKAISDKIDRLFQLEDKTVKTLEDGGLLRLKSCLVEVPELECYVLNPRVKDALQAYFGSAYKVYSCDVYRTVPQQHENPEETFGSLKWHFDNCPAALLKIMVYLTDTTQENGALTLVGKDKSVELKNRGFWDRENAGSFVNDIEAHALTLEAPAGTALLFSVHHCIHKATLPSVRHRDVAVFLVQPTLKQQAAFSEHERLTFSHNYGYCINPFLGTPLRYGNE